MSDREGELSLEMSRGAKAQAVLDNPLVKEALEVVKEHFQIQMMNSKSDETEFRDLCWRSMKAADLFHQFFLRQVETGQLASKELEQIRKNKTSPFGAKDPYGAIV